MWELDYKESWALKNCCFWTVVLEKILESPLECKEIEPVNPKGNQSWVFIGKTDAELKLQYFGHLMRRADSLEKTLILGEIEGRKRKGWQKMRWLDDITSSTDISLSKLWEMVKDRGVWHAAIHGVTKNQTWLSNWTKTIVSPSRTTNVSQPQKVRESGPCRAGGSSAKQNDAERNQEIKTCKDGLPWWHSG